MSEQIPQVFRDIIKNNNRTAELRALGADITQSQWRELKELRRDLRQSLIPGAEKMLKWNTDKGDNLTR